jgi:hypothetical protein
VSDGRQGASLRSPKLLLASAIALATLASFYAAALRASRPDDHLRYRMTVVVGIDDKEVSKSGVIGVERSWTRDYFLRWHHQTKVDGEAIFVDMGAGPNGWPRNIVVTLLSQNKVQGQGAADRWPYWGDPYLELLTWGRGLHGPFTGISIWALLAGWYPLQIHTTPFRSPDGPSCRPNTTPFLSGWLTRAPRTMSRLPRLQY